MPPPVCVIMLAYQTIFLYTLHPMSTSLTPRQFGVIADYMAAGQPMAVAALAAGVLPPVAEAAIGGSPWFGEVLDASRRLQAMHQPE